MTDLERKITEIQSDLAAIKKALGIGIHRPANVVDIKRKALIDAERLKRGNKTDK